MKITPAWYVRVFLFHKLQGGKSWQILYQWLFADLSRINSFFLALDSSAISWFLYLYTLNNSSRSTCNLKYDESIYGMVYGQLYSSLIRCGIYHRIWWPVDREFSDPTITHHGKFTQHAARSGDARFTPRTRLPDWRSVLLCWSFLPDKTSL